MTDGDENAVISSDVDYLKMNLVMQNGVVMQKIGDDCIPYDDGVRGLITIEEDGAYDVHCSTGSSQTQ